MKLRALAVALAAQPVLRCARDINWVCLKMGCTPNYSHLVGIMISKTIGFRGTQHFQTNPTASSLSLRLSKRLRVRRLSPIFGAVPMLGGPRDSKSKAQPHQQFDSKSQVPPKCAFWRSISPKCLSPNILKQTCTLQFLSSLKAANRWCKLHKSQRTRIASAIGIGVANFLSLTEQAA